MRTEFDASLRTVARVRSSPLSSISISSSSTRSLDESNARVRTIRGSWESQWLEISISKGAHQRPPREQTSSGRPATPRLIGQNWNGRRHVNGAGRFGRINDSGKTSEVLGGQLPKVFTPVDDSRQFAAANEHKYAGPAGPEVNDP